MSARCERTRLLLSAYVEGSLPETERSAVAGHLAECAECRGLAEALRAGLSGLRTPPAPDLTRAVMAATSGSACGRCEGQLVAHCDGALDPDSNELVSQHLEHCRGCRELARVLGWLDGTLPAMREVEPDEAFTREVLARTSARRPRAWERWAEGLRAWTRRPLFPLEAAYAATLVLALLFGTKLSPFQDAPQAALTWLRGESGGTHAAGTPLFAEIRQEAGAGVEQVVGPAGEKVQSTRVRVFQALESRGRAAWPGLVEVGDGMAGFVRAMFGEESQGFAPSLQQIGDGFRQSWRGLSRPQEEAEVPQGP